MRDLPSCFSENAVQIHSSPLSNSSKSGQNMVTCIYQCRIRGRAFLIIVSWSRSLMGQVLSVSVDDSAKNILSKVDIKPWLFSKRKGSKSLEVNTSKIDIYWDLSSAKFGSGPEPLEGFYVCVVMETQMALLLGDMKMEALQRTGAISIPFNATFVARRENVYGKTVFCTKARLCEDGQVHDIVIECDTTGVSEPCLLLRVDCKTVMQVKRLHWKFRGNQTILVDDLMVELFWDVHNWLFGPPVGNAIFMFKACMSAEKMWDDLQHRDSNESSLPLSQRILNSKSHNLGFSLILYAWKNE